MMTGEPDARWHAEDLRPDQAVDLGTWTFSSDEIVAFGTAWDPLPIHTDRDAAAASDFGGLIASGVHSLAVMQRLAVAGFYGRTAVIAGKGFSTLDLPRPIRAGTTAHGTLTVVSVDAHRPGAARVRTRSTLHDDRQRLLLDVSGLLVVRRRHSADRPGEATDVPHADEAPGTLRRS